MIEGNTVGTVGVANSGCEIVGCAGISISNNNATGTHKVTIKSNQIHDTEGSAILVISGGGSDVSTASLTIQNNTISNPDQGATAANPAVLIQSGSTIGTDTSNTCADISSNTITGTWSLGTTHLSSVRVRSLTTVAGSFALLGFNPATEYPNSTSLIAACTGNVGTAGNVADYVRSVNPGITNSPDTQNATSATQGAAAFTGSVSCP